MVSLNGLIAPGLKEVHRDIRAGRHVHYWLKGGRGSTKSSFIGLQIVLGIIKDPLANAIALRKVGVTLGTSVYSQIQWAIDSLQVQDFFRPYKSPPGFIYLPTGQQIVFRGADDKAKIKSIKLPHGYFKFGWYEELDEFDGMEEVRNINQSLMRGGEVFQFFYSYNPPKSVNNWANAEANVARPDRMVHHSDYRTVPRHWLGEQFFREAEILRETNEKAYRHEYLGEATGTGGAVFENVELRTITDEEISRFDKLYSGLDWGYSIDPTSWGKMNYYAPTKTLNIFDEYYKVEASYDNIADAIKPRTKRLKVTADSAEPRSIDELKKRGIYIVGAKKGPDSVDHGVKWLQGLTKIVIDPVRCPNTAREFTGYEYERDRHGNFKAGYPDKDNHSIDMTRYAMESVITNRSWSGASS